MQSKAVWQFDRNYFESNYDDALRHRLRWRKFAIPFSSFLIVLGIGMASVFRQQWLYGVTIATLGFYELAAALTHKNRWIKGRLKNIRPDKSIEIVFHDDHLTITSTAGTSTVKLSAFVDVTNATNGVFLIPDNGVSIYVPKSSVQPPEAYEPLIQSLKKIIGSKK